MERPQGDLVFREERNAFTGKRDLYIEQADPRILISDYFVDAWRNGFLPPTVTLTGDVVTIQAVNRKVIYRLGEHVAEWHAYVAEWPD